MKYYEYGKPAPLGTKEEKKKSISLKVLLGNMHTALDYHPLPFQNKYLSPSLLNKQAFTEPLLTYEALHGCSVIKVKNQSLARRWSHQSAEDSKLKTNTAEASVSHTTIGSSSFAIQRKKFPNLPVVEGERRGSQATGKGRNYCQTCKERTPDKANIMAESIETREKMWQFPEPWRVRFGWRIRAKVESKRMKWGDI